MGKTEIVITIVVFNLFFILFIVGIVVFIRQYKLKKKEHIGMLTSQTEAHQKELLATQIEIQQQTMQHIGREIHDNIGQKLTLASLYTQQLWYVSSKAEFQFLNLYLFLLRFASRIDHQAFRFFFSYWPNQCHFYIFVGCQNRFRYRLTAIESCFL